MITEEFWTSWLAFAVFAAIPLLLGVVSIAFSLYLSRRHLEALKEALKNSRYIYVWGPSLGKRGLIWSLLEIAKIAGMVTWSNAYIRMEDVNPVDLKNFPPYLKRLLIIDAAMKIFGFSWMIVGAILINFK